MEKKFNKIIVIKIISLLMLLWALSDNPYSYYQILRWVICGTLGYSSYIAYNNKKLSWAWMFGIIAVLYNPITPIYLNREIWSVIDVIVVIILLVSLFKDKYKKIS